MKMEENNNELDKILEIVKFFDDARWEHINKKKINHKSFIPDISESGIILTHWLRYITNRNMNAENLWEKASKCLSTIVKEVETENNYKSILIPNGPNSFFQDKNNYKKYRLFYDDKEKPFSSRYYTSDYYSIISTFEILKNEKYRFSIGKYINSIFDLIKDDNENHIMQKIIFSLYLLTYYYNPQLGVEDVESKEFDIFEMAKLRSEIVNIIISDNKIFNLTFNNFINNRKNKNVTNDLDPKLEIAFKALFEWQKSHIKRRIEKKEKKSKFKINTDNFKESTAFKLLFEPSNLIFREKRIWCAFRDFIKNEEFKKLFIKDLSVELKYFLFDKESKPRVKILKSLELPGDTWNNRPQFWKCLNKNKKDNIDCWFKINKVQKEEIKPVAPLLHELLIVNEKYKDKNEFYPEQFDFTFDFVSCMCEPNNCDICPFGRLLYEEKGTNLNMLCIENKDKYCPIAAIACNYKIQCKGECIVSKILLL